MRAGDLVLTPLPQADGRTKNRPCVALCQMPQFGDWLVCGVSTQLHHAVPGFDDTIASTDLDFAATGLKAPSLIRLGFLAVIPASHLLGSIGSLAPERRHAGRGASDRAPAIGEPDSSTPRRGREGRGRHRGSGPLFGVPHDHTGASAGPAREHRC